MASRLVQLARAAQGLIFRASAPFSGAPQPSPSGVPESAYQSDQSPPPPMTPTARRGYHDHTFTASSVPIASGFTLDRARAAMRLHRQGYFLESYLFAVASLSFGPVFAALAQRVSPAQAQPRFVRGGSEGLARLVREEVEEQLAPRSGLWSSPTFPAYLWGSIALSIALFGFAVLQHVLGAPDPETGVRPVYTRMWPVWAVQYQPWRRTFVALTTEQPVDILNDGKFTLIADTEEPHLFCAAILALTDPVMQGIQATQARASYVEKYGNPKPVATMPEKVAVRSPEGDAFFSAVDQFREVDGMIILAHGATLDFAQLAAETSSVFKDTDENVWKYIAAILLGSDGTISKTGVYQSPDFAGVRHDIVARNLGCAVRGVNEGHVKTYVYFNYSSGIEVAKARGRWLDPVVEIPLPDPAADARRDSLTKRMAAVPAQIEAERKAGALVTQDRVNLIASAHEVEPFILAPSDRAVGITDKDIENKIVAPDEVRAARNLPPLPDGIGSVAQLAKERADGKDKTGPAKPEPAPPAQSGTVRAARGQRLRRSTKKKLSASRIVTSDHVKIGAYSEDQERDDDGRFGSGGGSSGSGGGDDGKGKDPPKESGGDKPERTKHESARETSTQKEADAASANFERLQGRKENLEKRYDDAAEKAERAQERADKAENEQKVAEKSRPDPEDDTRPDDVVFAEAKDDEARWREIEIMQAESDRLDSARIDLSWRLDSTEIQRHYAAQESDDADEHAAMAKLSDADYGKAVTERADAAPSLTLKANQAVNDASEDDRSWREADARVMADSQERWESWRDKWEAGPGSKPEKEAPPTTGPDTSIARKADKSASSSAKAAEKADARATSSESMAAKARAKADAANGDRKEQLDARASAAEEKARERREDHADAASKAANCAEHAEMAKLPDEEYERAAYARIDKAEDDLDAAQEREEKARKSDDGADIGKAERESARRQADVDYWNETLDAYYEAKPSKR